MTKNFQSLDGLRAWMAWWVVCGHALELGGTPGWLPGPLAHLIPRVSTPVTVFIVVSGFVITHLLLSKQENYAAYLARRFMRLAPVYYACLLLAVATMPWYREVFVDVPAAIGLGSDFQAVRLERLAQVQDHWWAHIAAHVSLLHGLIPDAVLPFASSSLLSPAWSLSLEWQFYLLAPGIVALLLRGPRALVVGLALMVAIGWGANRLTQPPPLFPSMLWMSLQWFALGIGSRLLLERVPVLAGARTLLALLPLAACVVLKSLEGAIWSLWLLFVLFEAGRLQLPSAAAGVLDGLRALAATNPLLRTMGRCSYSTYLVHIPLFAIAGHAVAQWHGIAAPAELRAAIGLAIAGVALLSPLMYRLIEQPGIRLGSAWARRVATPAAPAALTR